MYLLLANLQCAHLVDSCRPDGIGFVMRMVDQLLELLHGANPAFGQVTALQLSC